MAALSASSRAGFTTETTELTEKHERKSSAFSAPPAVIGIYGDTHTAGWMHSARSLAGLLTRVETGKAVIASAG
jgi:hypothetical protein